MFDSFVTGVVHLLTVMFVAGVAGCVVVIPVVAYKMFAVLLEKDTAEDHAEMAPGKEL